MYAFYMAPKWRSSTRACITTDKGLCGHCNVFSILSVESPSSLGRLRTGGVWGLFHFLSFPVKLQLLKEDKGLLIVAGRHSTPLLYYLCMHCPLSPHLCACRPIYSCSSFFSIFLCTSFYVAQVKARGRNTISHWR